ncbi:MAG: cupin domain-containing protein [Anaerolineae bacterium]|jgi:predicted cupin superfamily sugar epimerase|nr:cupin domain-containing protein [Anaerolineae bacterium]
MADLTELFTPEQLEPAHPDTLALLKQLPWEYIPVEGALYYQTWVSKETMPDGSPAGTAILAMYCEHPFSASCFHRLDYDEVWHFYGGDPLRLFLLHPDGSTETVVMGSDVLAGQKVQYTIPSGTWQGGELIPGGRYALFGCTVAPGFVPAIFEAAVKEELVAQYPAMEEAIRRLSINDDVRQMTE